MKTQEECRWTRNKKRERWECQHGSIVPGAENEKPTIKDCRLPPPAPTEPEAVEPVESPGNRKSPPSSDRSRTTGGAGDRDPGDSNKS